MTTGVGACVLIVSVDRFAGTNWCLMRCGCVHKSHPITTAVLVGSVSADKQTIRENTHTRTAGGVYKTIALLLAATESASSAHPLAVDRVLCERLDDYDERTMASATGLQAKATNTHTLM